MLAMGCLTVAASLPAAKLWDRHLPEVHLIVCGLRLLLGTAEGRFPLKSFQPTLSSVSHG